MAKPVSEYVCQTCGHRAPKWLGKCPECAEWNSFSEEVLRGRRNSTKPQTTAKGNGGVQPITSVRALNQKRWTTGISEFDRTLGGGMVEGSLTLIGGNPGI